MRLGGALVVVLSLLAPAIARADCAADADCGAADSGRVCVDRQCVDGCRGEMGNACPADQTCSSTDANAGTCTATDHSAYGIDISEDPNGVDAEGTGIACSASGGPTSSGWSAVVVASAAALARRRRRGITARG